MMTAPACQWAWMAEALDDGRLHDDARVSFERHAAGCAVCRRASDDATWLRRRMEKLPAPALTDFEHRRERDRLLGRAVSQRIDRGQRAGSARGLWMAAGAVGAAAALLIAARVVVRRPPARDAQVAAAAAPAPDEPPHYDVTGLARAVWSTHEEGSTARIDLTQGSAAFHVHKLRPGQRFFVQLPDGEIEVRGTRFVVDIENDRTRYVVVIEGKVAFRRAGAPEALLLGGQRWDAPAATPTPTPAAPSVAPSTTSTAPRMLRATTSMRAKATRAKSKRTRAARALVMPAAPPVSSTTSGEISGDGAAPAARAASAANPAASAASAQFARAMTAFRGARYADADAAWRAFIAEHPDDPRVEDAAFLRMVGRARSHDRDGAVDLARRYLAQFPNGLRRQEAQLVIEQAR